MRLARGRRQERGERAAPAKTGARNFPTFHRDLRLRLQRRGHALAAQQLRRLGEVRRHPAGLVAGKQLGRRAPADDELSGCSSTVQGRGKRCGGLWLTHRGERPQKVQSRTI